MARRKDWETSWQSVSYLFVIRKAGTGGRCDVLLATERNQVNQEGTTVDGLDFVFLYPSPWIIVSVPQ